MIDPVKRRKKKKKPDLWPFRRSDLAELKAMRAKQDEALGRALRFAAVMEIELVQGGQDLLESRRKLIDYSREIVADLAATRAGQGGKT